MVEDSPEELIHIMTTQNYWEDHPLGRSILGNCENILRFDGKTIRRFFQRFYHPDRIMITAAGNIEHQRLVDLLATEFEHIQTPVDGFPQRTIPPGRKSVMIRSKSLEQIHICFSTPGLAISDPKRFALSLLNTVLGGNMSSRLFQKIRELEGLAYTIYSFASSHQDAGMFGIYTAVNPSQAQITTELILDELAKMRRYLITSSELKDAKEYTIGNLYLASESPDNQMVRLAHNELYFNRHIPLPEVIEKVEFVTAEEIHQLAQRHFSSEKLALALLGPIRDASFYNSLMSV